MAEREFQRLLRRYHSQGYNPEVGKYLRPGALSLLQWLREEKVVKKATLGIAFDEANAGGSWQNLNASGKPLKHLTIAATKKNPRQANASFFHETVHALLDSRLPSNTAKIAELYNGLHPKDRLFRTVPPLPKHWKEGKVDNPLLKEHRGTHLPPSQGWLTNTLRRTANRRLGITKESIPKGQSWSGLKDRSGSGNYEEGSAYYFTSPGIIGTAGESGPNERSKEFAMFLLDYGVPMSVAYRIMQELTGSAEKP